MQFGRNAIRLISKNQAKFRFKTKASWNIKEKCIFFIKLLHTMANLLENLEIRAHVHQKLFWTGLCKYYHQKRQWNKMYCGIWLLTGKSQKTMASHTSKISNNHIPSGKNKKIPLLHIQLNRCSKCLWLFDLFKVRHCLLTT